MRPRTSHREGRERTWPEIVECPMLLLPPRDDVRENCCGSPLRHEKDVKRILREVTLYRRLAKRAAPPRCGIVKWKEACRGLKSRAGSPGGFPSRMSCHLYQQPHRAHEGEVRRLRWLIQRCRSRLCREKQVSWKFATSAAVSAAKLDPKRAEESRTLRRRAQQLALSLLSSRGCVRRIAESSSSAREAGYPQRVCRLVPPTLP